MSADLPNCCCLSTERRRVRDSLKGTPLSLVNSLKIIHYIDQTNCSTFLSPLVSVEAVIASETNLQQAIKGPQTRSLARVQNIRLFALSFRHS